MSDKFKIGIVGHGFVGQAVDYAFTNPIVEKFYVDPKYGTNIDNLVEWLFFFENFFLKNYLIDILEKILEKSEKVQLTK